MKKPLGTLIRLQKRELDEQRAIIVALEGELATVRAAIEALAREVASERDVARTRVAESTSLAPYLKKAHARRLALASREAALIKKLEEEQAKLQIMFEALKRYEIALENLLTAEAAERERQDRLELDEVGLNQFRRTGGQQGKGGEGGS